MPPLKKNICAHKVPQYGPNRSIMLHVQDPDGEHVHGPPVRLILDQRASTTAHGRIKVTLGIPAKEEDGTDAFAVACEFRLEMN